ncbi:hypothetical protein M4D55_11240 [Metabacillus idriensis]|uniref:Uncharacterized protein n=1 Tax=Metabacillus idriensis TaxID=324768 RepID=A0A6I2MFF1_9BACI|nr:hypothetical protein [Metabacillus idriensis]MCM3596350.1 hypothetical protein [Metabacillus idriensis]MRX55887.1 hypothetical protein [Metabacillus idriensis]OHR71232.1 hypothetical protein HMPREF3291_24780 [Bacillus sp. HMSC76G11]
MIDESEEIVLKHFSCRWDRIVPIFSLFVFLGSQSDKIVHSKSKFIFKQNKNLHKQKAYAG